MLIQEDHILYELSNKRKLARLLHTDVKSLDNFDDKVYPFKKRVNGKKRNLHNTNTEYKGILRRFNSFLIKTNVPSYVYAGVPDKDFLDNAKQHLKNPYLQNADIKNFFPSTKESYVYGLFNSRFKMSPDVSKILTNMTTYKSEESSIRHLPQGFPTSTILSFLSYFDLFNGIKHICEKEGIHFTLFVDDMTFSSENRIPKSFLKYIKRLLGQYDLDIHPNKTLRYYPNQVRVVTGVAISPSSSTLMAPHKFHKKIYYNFSELQTLSFTTYKEFIEWKQLVIKTKGQLNSLKRIEPEANHPFMEKVIKDIEFNFIAPHVKNVPYKLLRKEFDHFMLLKNRKNIIL